MKKYFIYFYILFIINIVNIANASYETEKALINNKVIKKKLSCNNLVGLLGGLNKIEILWLGNLKQEKFQYALINTSAKSNKKIFYLCENLYKKKISSKKTMEVLNERNIMDIYYNTTDLFTDIFSLTSKESRNYIMSTLNLRSFNMSKNELNKAYIAGLMKLNEKLNPDQEKKLAKKKKIKKIENKSKEQTENKQEFVPEKSTDKNPPKIIIAKNLTYNTYNYNLSGTVKDDTSNNVYVEIDGMIQQAVNGRFSFERFSIVDEKVSIIAIDQWGNRSKPKIVNVKIDFIEKTVEQKLEKLNPLKIKTNILSSDKVALIIGIENYSSNPKATYANLDAKYFYQYAKNIFGVKNENIKILIDNEANLVSSLGALNKWLPSKIKKKHTELIIFFAGHGLASPNGKELYLLPQDGDSDLLERTAISRNEVFDIVKKLQPKKVTVFFDTCYSGVSRDEETLMADARPLRIIADDQEGIPDNFTIFSASQLDQISSGLKDAKHGIFSYYLMKGLEGNADANGDKKITNGELIVYMDTNVSQKASELGRQQNPSLAGDPDKVLISYR
tara:strand:- start:37 stop:1719 length:1683 start_codon:yes stop_codon:yes gene_type:complete